MVPKLLADVQYQISGPGLNPSNGAQATSMFETYAGQLVGVLTIIGVLYFVVQIIFAGFAFISSQGDEKQIEASRKRLTEGVLGLTVIVIALGIGTLLAKLAGIPNVLDIESMFTKMGL